MPAPARFCKVCGKPLQGRIDKKYCDINCKNQYHIDMRSLHLDEVNMEMKFLLRNRTILHELLDQKGVKKRKIKRYALQRKGFRFQNYTGNYLNKQGKTYHYVFDYSFMNFSDQEVLIIKR